jgi:hypothetical protein
MVANGIGSTPLAYAALVCGVNKRRHPVVRRPIVDFSNFLQLAPESRTARRPFRRFDGSIMTKSLEKGGNSPDIRGPSAALASLDGPVSRKSQSFSWKRRGVSGVQMSTPGGTRCW